MTTTSILSKTITAAATLVLCGANIHAATLVNSGTTADGAGELFVGFHATGGQGIGQSVVIDLGAVSPYAAVAPGGTLTFAGPGHNVGADLAAVFGSTWYERTDLLWSAVSGVQSTIPATSSDQTSTLYGSVTSPTYNPSAGPAATAWNRNTNSAQNPVANRIIASMATGIGGFTSATAGATSNIAREAVSDAQNYATWMPGGSNVSGLGNTAFGGFTTPAPAANFEQAFAIGQIASGVEGALDVFRLYRSNFADPEATPTTGIGAGSYQFTLTIDQTGNIAGVVLAVPEPASIGLLVSGGLLVLGSRRRKTAPRA